MWKKFSQLKCKYRNLFGIDIDGGAARGLALAKNRAGVYLLQSYFCESLPSNAAAQKSENQDETRLIALRKVSANLPKKFRIIATALPSSAVISKEINLDANLKNHELKNFLSLNAEKYLGYPPDSISMDYQLKAKSNILNENRFLGNSTNRPEQCGIPARRQGASNGSVLPVHDRCARRSQQRWKPQCEGYMPDSQVTLKIVATRKEKVTGCLALFQKANLALKIIDVDIFALARSAKLLIEDSAEVNAIINIDNNRLLLCVLKNQEILYSQANYFTEETEPMALTEVVAQINANLEMYTSIATTPIKQIILAGSRAREEELLALLNKVIELPITIANPFRKMRLAKNINAKEFYEIAPAMMISLGLVLRKFTHV